MSEKIMPLEGLKVVDLSTIVCAPMAAGVLATFGADVIKVEPPTGDGERHTHTYLKTPGGEVDPIYTIKNTGKRHIAIDIKSEGGREVMLKLLEEADIFVTNVRLKGLERLGIAYEQIKVRCPRLIYAHFTGYGPKGPNKDDPGFDSTVFWLRGGMIADWQTKDARYPFGPTYAFGDMVTSSSLVSAILMAVIGREKTGKGGLVGSSLYSSGIWCNAHGVVETQFEKKELNPVPEDRMDPLNDYYMCGDGLWFSLNSLNDYDRDFQVVIKGLGLEELVAGLKSKNRQELQDSGEWKIIKDKFREIFASHTSAEMKKIFQEIGMPCDVAVHTYTIASDEQAIVNDYLEDVEYKDGTHVMMPTAPMYFESFDRRPVTPAGGIGEDTAEIMAELGYSEEEIAAMKESGNVK